MEKMGTLGENLKKNSKKIQESPFEIMKCLTFRVLWKHIQSTKAMLFSWSNVPKSDSGPYSTLVTRLPILQIHNYASCIDIALLIRLHYTVFSCTLIIIPWTVKSHELLKLRHGRISWLFSKKWEERTDLIMV